VTEQNQQFTDEQVRKAVERILASRGFAASPRLADFLRFVTEETLSGRSTELKEALIGLHVYRKDAAYNPASDSTVRTEASRLRSRLQTYYDEEGASDSVRISMPKGGYVIRWGAPPAAVVEPLAVESAPPVVQSASAPALAGPTSRPMVPAWVLPAVLASIATGGILWWTTIRTPQPAPPASVEPLTSFEGGEYEPSFSLDGRKLAFTWNGKTGDNYNIYVMDIEGQRRGEAPRQVTDRPGGEGSPAWSPDGKQLAFVTATPSGDGGLYIADLETKQERKITATKLSGSLHDRYLAWSPDGRTLVLANREADGQPFFLEAVDVRTGQHRRLTNPPGQTLGDTGPSFSPDGKTIAFRRSTSDAVKDIWLVPAEGGEARPLTEEKRHIPAHDWEPEGQSILFVSNRDGTARLWRVGVTPGSVPVGPLPYGQDAYFLAVARQGKKRVAFAQIVQDSDIWRLDLKTAGSEPEKLISSTRREASPQYSPDGLRIAFRSNRTGADEIWLREEGSEHPLTSFKGPLTGSPRWSPNGARLVFDSRPHGHSDIFMIAREGGQPVRVTTHNSDDVLPCFSPDGQWLYFASNRSATWQVWRLPAGATEGAAAAKQVTGLGGFAPQLTPDGKHLVYAKSSEAPSLWQAPLTGGAETLLLPQSTPGSWGLWAAVPDGILHVLPEPSPGTLALFDPRTRQSRAVARLKKRLMFWDSGFSVSPDGRYLLFGHMERDGSDIFLVEE